MRKALVNYAIYAGIILAGNAIINKMEKAKRKRRGDEFRKMALDDIIRHMNIDLDRYMNDPDYKLNEEELIKCYMNHYRYFE